VVSTELRSRIALLYRRAGFGGRPDELDAGVAAGYKATVDRLLRFGPDPAAAPPLAMAPYPPPADTLPTDPVDRAAALNRARQTANQDANALSLWWLDRMATTANPLQEKLTLFWHGHFATSVQKVVDPGYMYGQNQIFRTAGAGNFTDLTLAVSKDPAMLIWLDANLDRKASPNENFARELLELFTVGIGHYSEDDIRNAARAFTGWQLNAQTRAFSFAANQHDTGMRTFFGQSGAFTGEDIVRMATTSPDAARFVAQKVFSHFARPVAFADPIVTQLAAGFARDLDVGGLLRAVFNHPQFTSASTRAGLVKQPIEYLAGALRALGLHASGNTALLGQLGSLGQAPLAPPNVGGWPQNAYWLNTSTALQRLRLAAALVPRADLSALARTPPAGRPKAAAELLGLVDGWGPATTKALTRAIDDPAVLMTLALVAPEYLLA
jgi:uncharacterized protein (DUF1800 family)